MNCSADTLEALLTQIAHNENLSTNIKITYDTGTNKGDGYMGEIIMMTIEDVTTGKKLHLVAKVSMKDQKVRKMLPIHEIFVNEVLAYRLILPELMRLQETWKIPNPFKAIPKCYSASSEMGQEYVILENLKYSGFGMLSLDKLLDHKHIEIIFEQYAKMHALSFVLGVKNTEKYYEIIEGINGIADIVFDVELGRTFSRTVKHIQNALREKGHVYELYDSYAQNCCEIMAKMTRYRKTDYHCFLHGDCWSNNMLFKYKTENGCEKLKEVKLLDWQFCYVGSPVNDLSYVMYSGATKEVIDNLSVYLEIYHENFSTFLSNFGLDAKSIFPFEEFRRQWRENFHFGAILGSFVRQIRASSGEYIDAVNFETSDDSTFFDALVDAPFDKEQVVDCMKHLCEHFVNVSNNKF